MFENGLGPPKPLGLFKESDDSPVVLYRGTLYVQSEMTKEVWNLYEQLDRGLHCYRLLQIMSSLNITFGQYFEKK